MKGLKTRTVLSMLLGALLALAACAPAAQPAAPAPAAPAAPGAPAQPKQQVPAAAPVAPVPVATATASAPAPAAPKPGAIKYGGTLIYNRAQHPGGDDPFYNNTQGLQKLGNTYLQLIRAERGDDFFSGFKYVPDLAESWTQADDTTIVFKLKKGIKWAPVPPLNSREVTADDVVYSYQRFTDPQSVVRGAFSIVKDVEAIDKYTVKLIGFEKSLLLIEAARQHPAWIIPKELVEERGDLRNVMIGAGPFYEIRREPGGATFFAKNPNYYDKDKVGPDKLQWSGASDRSTIIASFRAGIFASLGSLSKDELDLVLKTNPGIQVDRAWRGGSSRFNVRADVPNEPWHDYRVRKALSKALDRQGIVAALYAPDDPWASGMIPPGLQPWALPVEELEKMDFLMFDPKEAKRLMKEAGFPNGFKTSMCWPTVGIDPSGEYQKQTLLVAQMWKENIGVEVDLKKYSLNSSGWLGTCFAGKYEGAIANAGAGSGNNWFEFLQWLVHSKGKWPVTQIKSAELDKLIDEAMATLDVEEQVKKAREIQRLLLTSEKYGYWFPTPTGAIYNIAQPWAKNWRPVKANDTWETFVWLDK